jgi:hypothetical protein
VKEIRWKDTDFCSLGKEPVAGCCEHGNGLPDFIRRRKEEYVFHGFSCFVFYGLEKICCRQVSRHSTLCFRHFAERITFADNKICSTHVERCDKVLVGFYCVTVLIGCIGSSNTVDDTDGTDGTGKHGLSSSLEILKSAGGRTKQRSDGRPVGQAITRLLIVLNL